MAPNRSSGRESNPPIRYHEEYANLVEATLIFGKSLPRSQAKPQREAMNDEQNQIQNKMHDSQGEMANYKPRLTGSGFTQITNNDSARHPWKKPRLHCQTKLGNIHDYYIRSQLSNGHLMLDSTPGNPNTADLLTKLVVRPNPVTAIAAILQTRIAQARGSVGKRYSCNSYRVDVA
jgi:hypothetical protein